MVIMRNHNMKVQHKLLVLYLLVLEIMNPTSRATHFELQSKHHVGLRSRCT